MFLSMSLCNEVSGSNLFFYLAGHTPLFMFLHEKVCFIELPWLLSCSIGLMTQYIAFCDHNHLIFNIFANQSLQIVLFTYSFFCYYKKMKRKGNREEEEKSL